MTAARRIANEVKGFHGFIKFLMVLVGLGVIASMARFIFGLGATTNLNDTYPWGLWIAFDVVTGTALASGGFAVALLVFFLNRWRYHPLVRPAMLTSAQPSAVHRRRRRTMSVGLQLINIRLGLAPGELSRTEQS